MESPGLALGIGPFFLLGVGEREHVAGIGEAGIDLECGGAGLGGAGIVLQGIVGEPHVVVRGLGRRVDLDGLAVLRDGFAVFFGSVEL